MYKLLCLLLTLFLFFNSVNAQQNFEQEAIRTSTFEDRAINIVFMGEGYTAQQQGDFLDNVRRLSDGLLAEPPFSLYTNYFNVYAIKVISDNANGYFENRLSASNLININATKVNNIRDAYFPNNQNRVFVVVLVNTNIGLGNTIGTRVVMKGGSGAKVFSHEIAHSFGGVADEYWTGTGQNVNKALINTLPENLSWRRWIDMPDNNGGVVGRYPYSNGVNAESDLWIMPSRSCLMRFIDEWKNPRFCPVCSQAIIQKVHSLIPSIGSTVPTLSNVTDVRNFNLENVIKPNPSTFIYDWYLGNNYIGGNSSIEIPISAFGGAGNNFKVKVVVRDATPLVRAEVNLGGAEIDGVTIYTNTWNVVITQQYYNQQIAILPVEFGNFTAKKHLNSVGLVWNTLSEKNNDHFMVEKSVNGKSFSLLTTVQGNGTTNQPKSYTVFDDNPFSGTSYYRLTQVDFNGDKNIIDTKSVNFSLSPEKYTVYPNPAYDHLYWKNKQGSREAIEFSLIDIIGRVVYQKVENPSSDNSIMIRPPVKPTPGLYVLRVKERNEAAHYMKVLFQ